MMIYNPNVDLVNDNVYTKFGLNKSIRSQDSEKKKESSLKHLRTKVTPDLHLTYSKNGGNLGLVLNDKKMEISP